MKPFYENILTATATVDVQDNQVQGGPITYVVTVLQTSSTGTIQFLGYPVNCGTKSGFDNTTTNPLAFTVASTGVATTGAAAVATSTTQETYYVRADGLGLQVVWTRTGGTLRIAIGSARA